MAIWQRFSQAKATSTHDSISSMEQIIYELSQDQETQ